MAQLTFSDISGFGFVSSANRKGSVVKKKHTNTHQLNQRPKADFSDRGESPVTHLAPTLRLQCQRKTEFLATIKFCC